MLWKRTNALDQYSIDFEQESIRNMDWKSRNASEMVFIYFEEELTEKHALEEKGCLREDFQKKRNARFE